MREPVSGTFAEHSQVSVSQKRIARPVVLATRFLPGLTHGLDPRVLEGADQFP